MPRAHGNKGNGGNNTGLQLENWFQMKKTVRDRHLEGKDCFPGRTCHLSWGFNQPYPKMTPSIIRAEGLNQTTTHNHYASIIGRVTDLGAGWIPMKISRKWKTLFQTKLVCLLVELTSYKSVSHHIYGMAIPFTTITIINITGISAFNWKGKYQQRHFLVTVAPGWFFRSSLRELRKTWPIPAVIVWHETFGQRLHSELENPSLFIDKSTLNGHFQ